MKLGQPSYFLSPSWDLKPDELALGSVIVNPKYPLRSRLRCGHEEPMRSEVVIDGPHACSGVVNESKEWSAGLFANFLQLIASVGELSYTASQTQEIEYSCEKLETMRFTPSPEYIGHLASDEAVSAHFKFGGLLSKVFIVTGVKVATGVTITTTTVNNRGAKVQMGLSMPVADLDIGPRASWNSGTMNKHSVVIDGPIVFAYQIEKLKISRKGKASSEGYIRGAMLGNEVPIDDILELSGDELDEDEIEDMGFNIRDGIEEEAGEQCLILW
ncbi:hypothetical protein K4K53_001540 [Colletotrichum sp. SAR 10_77]|nr:hypothetical protein K4K53_001540 [Colletotrichum sp. SAR 10_77]